MKINLPNEIEGKRFYVTGANGFVGRNVVKFLLDKGAKSVLAVDDLSTSGGKWCLEEFLGTNPTNLFCSSLTVDQISDESWLETDHIIHLACKNILISTTNPFEDLMTNAYMTLQLLEVAKDFKIPMVFSSSASVYGNQRLMPTPEDVPLNPLSVYACSKLAAENYCITYNQLHDVDVSVVRYSNVYGPGQVPTGNYIGVVSKFIIDALNNNVIKVHGSGRQTRDYTYIDDVVKATLLALFSPKATGDVYNIGYGQEHSVNDLICEIGKWITINEVDYINLRDIDNIGRRVLNIEKARLHLNWIPEVSFEEGVRRTCMYILGNS